MQQTQSRKPYLRHNEPVHNRQPNRKYNYNRTTNLAERQTVTNTHIL